MQSKKEEGKRKKSDKTVGGVRTNYDEHREKTNKKDKRMVMFRSDYAGAVAEFSWGERKLLFAARSEGPGPS